MKFTKVRTDTFSTLQNNAGMIIKGSSGFNPATGTVTEANIIGATTGGLSISIVPTFTDYGENVDNVPKNTMELKRLNGWDCKISGTLVAISTSTAKLMLGAADIDSTDTTLVTPRVDLTVDDFEDVWFVGDYSDKNGNTNGGFFAVHLLNALSTGGLSLKTEDKEKGQFSFELTGHVSINEQDVVPVEVYIKSGTDEVPVVYTYVDAELTDGFKYGVTYYTRTGSGTEQSPYVYTEVSSGAEFDDQTTYYIKQVAS